ncbi:MAG: 5-aminolevulic acid synthase [Pseudorhodobacter sp.]|nr:MAG: 5-aminolevulic acid synthase [Pseudorhodobacter sp.]
MRLAPSLAPIALLLATPALAEPLSGKDAKKALFAPVKAEVEIMPEAGLPADQAEVLKTVGVGQPYYGAIAIAPQEGLMSEATVAAANFHDAAAASAAALAECDAKKKTETACVIAAIIRPEGWKDQGFGLSSDASAAFKDYDMKTCALAISPMTGAFGMAAGDGAADQAVKNCGAKNDKATDCTLVVQN